MIRSEHIYFDKVSCRSCGGLIDPVISGEKRCPYCGSLQSGVRCHECRHSLTSAEVATKVCRYCDSFITGEPSEELPITGTPPLERCWACAGHIPKGIAYCPFCGAMPVFFWAKAFAAVLFLYSAGWLYLTLVPRQLLFVLPLWGVVSILSAIPVAVMQRAFVEKKRLIRPNVPAVDPALAA